MFDLSPVLPVIQTAVPEVFLAVMAMVLLVFGVVREGRTGIGFMARYAAFVLLAVAVVLFKSPYDGGVGMNGLFVVDGFASFMKGLVLLGAVASLFLAIPYLKKQDMARFEYPILILFSTLGMMMMISANDLMALYMGLELQSLPLYVLAAMQTRDARSSEAGVKYFVLGAISSGMLLYGASMVYGFAGTTQFDMLAQHFAGMGEAETPVWGVVVGLVFMLAGMAFKVSAVPFHMWTPDVYEGAPTPVTAFFAIVPKMAALAMMARVLMGPFAELTDQWQQVVVFIAAGSMILGAIAGIVQDNIKRLLAYSSIGHMGYALIGLAVGSFDGLRGMMIYLSIYLVMSIGVFASVLMMHRRGKMLEKISDLAGASRNHPLMAGCIAVLMFSMAGIPPLAGFFGKLFIFQAAVASEMYILAVIGVLSSVVAAFYYLRVIKVMYFDDPVEKFDRPHDENSLNLIMYATTLLVIGFIVMPTPLIDAVQKAASTLLSG